MKNLHSSKTTFEAHMLQELFNDKKNFAEDFYQPDVFELIWIKKGSGYFTIDLEKRGLVDNTLYCLFPGQIHRLEPEDELVGYRIAFSEDFLKTANKGWQLPVVLTCQGFESETRVAWLDETYIIEIDYIITTMLWEYSNEHKLKKDILNGLLHLLIAQLTCQFGLIEEREASQVNKIYNKFISSLSSSFLLHKQVSDYASELSVSTSYLSEVVKRVSGFPAGYHIKQRLLLEAKRKAVCDSSSMKSIAYKLGFDDPSTFSKFFKSCTGTNFSEFRKQYA